ncbi:NAD(P)-binding protein [Plenodomus tracheiphilus IPT5]|uniref:D-xylose 1-dehydrogenase (NADP(+), D-xylono-1,5-lactone-forming) n=1 Tax=Plenodomus tracheiphilus IPT5 TaxID=1408161 RepID=A0A6A7B401_9PLEO|nr:NAD(P)-binding protein [Plenodomus tracheiphilus IPT5]
MAILGGFRRNWRQFNPPVPSKQEDALKFGILGAANIAPMALILPAKSHPQVIIHAVAARDKTRATAFANKHGIPVVKNSYEEILDDPAIDVVYIPLPTGLHLEWALKALAKGKHVLLEKPATSNAQEAEMLHHHRLLNQSGEGPILMEAFHSRFAPGWQQFLAVLDPPNVSHAIATAMVPSYIASDNDIRFDYSIGGGALLDLGTYPLASIRDAFGAEPEECVDAKMTPMAPPREKCDHTFYAKFRFPNGGIGEVNGTLRAPKTHFSLPTITVTHKPVPAPEEVKATDGKGTEATRIRKVTFGNLLWPMNYHYVTVQDKIEIRDAGSSTVKRQHTKTETKKAYTFREMNRDVPGEIHWSTYRYMLEEFVNKIKGRTTGSGVFVSHEESIAQSRALDMIYEKSGLGLRPSSTRVSEFV